MSVIEAWRGMREFSEFLGFAICILTIVLGACMFNKSRSMVPVTREIIYQVDTKNDELGRIPEVK